MSLDATIRPARQDEAEHLGEIGFASWAGSEHGELDGGRGDRVRLRQAFIGFGVKLWPVILVAELDGAPVGWASRENSDNYVSDLWVAPYWQGRGIGARLLDAMEAEIRAGGHATAELETRAGAVRAVRFYHRQGYGEVWRKEKFSEPLGYAVDKVRLVKALG